MIERLRRERDEAERIADQLEKEKLKLEAQLKKAEKELDAAVKAKIKISNYVKTVILSLLL